MARRAAVILSGGKAQRFQTQSQSWQDKALALLEGKPLLVHAVENVRSVVDEVVVCVNDEERKIRYRQTLEEHGYNVRIVVDEITEIGGPNVGIMSGLKAVQADQCFVAPCDMPFVKPEVADYLFNAAKGYKAAVPMWPDGRLETLIMVLQHDAGLEIVETLCRLKRSRSDDIPRGAAETLLVSPLKTIKSIDPELKSFVNINSKEDLKKLPTRSLQGPVKDDVKLKRGQLTAADLQLMREAAKMVSEKKFSTAFEMFDACRSRFEVCGSLFWAALAAECTGMALLEQAGQKRIDTQQIPDGVRVKVDETFLEAAEFYGREAEFFKEKGCVLLMDRALTDKARCKSQSRQV